MLREDNSSDLGLFGLFERLKKLAGTDTEDIKKEVTSSLSLSAGGQIVKGVTGSVTDRVVDWLVEQTLQELTPDEHFPVLSIYHVSYLTIGKKPITWVFASESSVASGKPRTCIIELSKVATAKSSGSARQELDPGTPAEDTDLSSTGNLSGLFRHRWSPVWWTCRAAPVPCSSPTASRERFSVTF